jgi:hypothetical protein
MSIVPLNLLVVKSFYRSYLEYPYYNVIALSSAAVLAKGDRRRGGRRRTLISASGKTAQLRNEH